jgi:hypothetical protein
MEEILRNYSRKFPIIPESSNTTLHKRTETKPMSSSRDRPIRLSDGAVNMLGPELRLKRDL